MNKMTIYILRIAGVNKKPALKSLTVQFHGNANMEYQATYNALYTGCLVKPALKLEHQYVITST